MPAKGKVESFDIVKRRLLLSESRKFLISIQKL
jgi:hypothetical protein